MGDGGGGAGGSGVDVNKGRSVRSRESFEYGPEMAAARTKYAPYVRNDEYGVIGELGTKVRVWVGTAVLVPVRMSLVVCVIFFFFLVCRCAVAAAAVVAWLRVEPRGAAPLYDGRRSPVVVWFGRWCARTLLFVLGFYYIEKRRVVGSGEDNSNSNSFVAVVSNHISYLDILYHMSDSFPSFVAKAGTRKVPLVGAISECMGCVYVDREVADATRNGVSGLVKARLEARRQEPHNYQPMLLFPEGTTTNGEYLLPFKTGAFLAGAPVKPVLLRYKWQHFSPAWETITAPRHIQLLCSQLYNTLEVVELPTYVPSAEEAVDPALYAANVRAYMAKEGGLVPSSLTLQDKRAYQSILLGKSFKGD
eukprot:jgi/Chlat1/3161/Chrsp219S00797